MPFAAAIPSGVDAFACDRIEDDKLYLTPAASIEPFKPYILHTTASYSGSVNGTVDPLQFPVAGFVSDVNGILNGAIEPQSITSGYVLQKDPNESLPKFYPVSGTFSIPSGKCWLTVPSGISAPSIRMIVGSPTDLKAVENQQNEQIYNILGMPVSSPQAGQVYIQNGQKFIQK